MPRVKWVLVNGTKYNLSSVLVIGHEDDFPQFGKVCEIRVDNGEVAFDVDELYTDSYDPHYHAYVVKPLTTRKTKQIISHSFHPPLTLNTLNHINYVVLKYHLFIPYTF